MVYNIILRFCFLLIIQNDCAEVKVAWKYFFMIQILWSSFILLLACFVVLSFFLVLRKQEEDIKLSTDIGLWILLPVYLSWFIFLHCFYCSRQVLIFLVAVILVKDVGFIICLFWFKQDIHVLWKYSQYFSKECYRVHSRYFKNIYQSPIPFEIEWPDADCLLCEEEKAKILSRRCGHLTVCKLCFKKIKKYPKCIICGSLMQKMQLSFFPSEVTEGYQKHFFIEKRLLMNQYVTCSSN